MASTSKLANVANERSIAADERSKVADERSRTAEQHNIETLFRVGELAIHVMEMKDVYHAALKKDVQPE